MRLNSFEDDTTYTPRSERVSFDLAARYRHGATRTIELVFEGNFTRFSNKADDTFAVQR